MLTVTKKLASFTIGYPHGVLVITDHDGTDTAPTRHRRGRPTIPQTRMLRVVVWPAVVGAPEHTVRVPASSSGRSARRS
jgi:hypothetical protein